MIEEENNGGSQILGYELYVLNNGVTDVIMLLSTDVSTQVTGLTGGETYTFTIAAYNKYGVGPTTPTLTIVAAQEPDAPSLVTVQISGKYALI
jgi:hypothetical protein